MEVDRADLEKICDALRGASAFFRRRDEMNAEAHLAREIQFSPLTSAVVAQHERLEKILGVDRPVFEGEVTAQSFRRD